MNLDRRGFLAAGAAAFALRASGAGPAPHAMLYLCSQPRLRSRHGAVVDLALQRRAAAHTSGWEVRDGKPVLAVGPVKGRAAHFHGQELVKEVARAWPVVAVAEYDGSRQPQVFLDWFRRSRGATAADGWLLDPAIGYAEHLNAEAVRHQDEQWCYFAVADTPTGDVVSGQEFVVRMRLQQADGTVSHRGLWYWFDAPRSRPAGDWRCVTTPLCGWRVGKANAVAGVLAGEPLADPAHELAVWGTDTVFRFPTVPPGVDPGRGRG